MTRSPTADLPLPFKQMLDAYLATDFSERTIARAGQQLDIASIRPVGEVGCQWRLPAKKM